MHASKPIRQLVKRFLPAAAVSRMKKVLNPTGTHWCRVVMNRECDDFVSSLGTDKLACLEISGDGSRWATRKWGSYQTTGFPEYDICAEPLEGEWDVIIVEQVLEHVRDPQRSVQNLFRMLRAGGVLIVTTPFLIKFHAYPSDFSRWTADGMRELLARSGFSRIAVSSWGNRACLVADMTDDNTWTYYKPGVHSLRNEPRFPIVVWAFAHK